MNRPLTLFEKIWNRHVVSEEPGAPALLYIDLHLLHEVTSPQAFEGLRRRGMKVRRPDLSFATADHSVSTLGNGRSSADAAAGAQVDRLERNCSENGITLFGPGNPRQGIVHVIGPELGLTRPGMTIVCGDSHTSTHGAFGALAFGIGTSEVEMVLATQCLLQRKPESCRVKLDGRLKPGVAAKDIILALIARIGIGGGTGCVFEYCGSAVRSLSMEERMTLCNMSIEAGARAGLIAPDDTTFEFLSDRPFSPRGKEWDRALTGWRRLPGDEDAVFQKEFALDVDSLEPMITFGTHPGMGIPVGAAVPKPEDTANATERDALEQALRYMDIPPGRPLLGTPIDVVFIGSCTNSRISDLRAAASILDGRKVHPRVQALIVPGSARIQRQAEAEGLDRIFKAAGAEWRRPGCSMCIAMNGDELKPGEYCVSTSNRNFEGRQGKGGRTFLASPLTAAACAVRGEVTDVRTLL